MRYAKRVLIGAGIVLALVCMIAVNDVSAGIDGTLKGRVVDEDDSGLAGVTVILTSKNQIRERAVLTDSRGSFIAPGLAPGDYTVVAKLPGFKAIQQEVTVKLDQITLLDFKLSAGELTETVRVTARRPVVSKAEAAGSYNIRKDYTESIPVARSYQSLLGLAPGVANSRETSNPNILGGTSNSNQYMLDGVSIRDTVTGTFGSNINYDSIEEVEVKLTGVSAEYGKFQGGLSNVILKSGGNNVTGSLRDEITAPSFENRYDSGSQNEFAPGAAPALPGRGQRDIRHDVEISLGGPVVRNTAWFFLSYNRNDTSAVAQLGNPNGGPLGDGTYSDPIEGDNSLGKITWQVSNSHKLQYDYFEDPALSPRCYGQLFWGGPCYDVPFVDNQQQGGFAWTGNWNAVWSSSVFTDVRVNHWENSFDITPLAPQTIRPDLIFESPSGTLGAGLAAGHAPTIDLTTGSLFDAPVFGPVPEERKRDEYDVKTTAFFNTEHTGTHTLKIGAQYTDGTREGSSILSGNGLIYTLGWVNPPEGLGGAPGCNANTVALGGCDPYDVNNRAYYVFYDFAPPGSGGPTSKETGIYVQDDWSLNDHWTFNLGLRWEKFQEENDVGEEVIDQSDFAPRLGTTFDVKGDGRHLIKATAASYLAGVNLTTLSPFVRAAGGQSSYDVYINSTFPTPGPPTWVLSNSVRPDPSTAGFDPDLEVQRIDELTLGYEHAINENWGVKLKYIDREWDNIIGQKFSYDYTGIDPATLLFSENDSSIERSYQGILIDLEKRLSNDWTFRANLVFGEAEGNTESDTGFSSFNSYPGVPQSTENRFGNLSFDVEQEVKLGGSYRLPIDSPRHSLEFGGTYTWSAGNPYAGNTRVNVVVGPGADGTQDFPLGTDAATAAGADQIATMTQYFQPRGEFQEPDIWTVDMQTKYLFNFSKDVFFEVRMEVRNLTDEQNPLSVTTNYTTAGPSASFGYPTSYSQFQNARNYRFNAAVIW